MRLLDGGLLAASLLSALFGGCIPDSGAVVRRPVPPMDKLRPADCDAALDTYRRLLQLPGHASVVITGRPVAPPPIEAQEQAIASFSSRCYASLVGNARRAITSCWSDSTDAASFRACNDRF